MKKIEWFERKFTFGLPKGMLLFYLERLEGTIARLERKISGKSENILSEKLGGKWSVKQNIGHLSEVDEIALKRIDEMLQGISTLSPAVFEPKQDYNSQNVRDVIKHFQENRLKNLARYRSLSETDLERSSLHPRLKVQMNPVDLAWFDAEHDDHHLVRINEILTILSK
jgi:uncharacterized damage-inducible protein DinB